jgi:hypothetical protein
MSCAGYSDVTPVAWSSRVGYATKLRACVAFRQQRSTHGEKTTHSASAWLNRSCRPHNALGCRRRLVVLRRSCRRSSPPRRPAPVESAAIVTRPAAGGRIREPPFCVKPSPGSGDSTARSVAQFVTRLRNPEGGVRASPIGRRLRHGTARRGPSARLDVPRRNGRSDRSAPPDLSRPFSCVFRKLAQNINRGRPQRSQPFSFVSSELGEC